jgi:hypothetical protein
MNPFVQVIYTNEKEAKHKLGMIMHAYNSSYMENGGKWEGYNSRQAPGKSARPYLKNTLSKKVLEVWLKWQGCKLKPQYHKRERKGT